MSSLFEAAQSTIIAVCGFAGSGKTTMNTWLAKEYQLPFFSADEIFRDLRDACAVQKLSLEDMQIKALRYDFLFSSLRRELKRGRSVVLDANFCVQATWQRIDRIKQEMPEVKCLFMILDCSFATCAERVEKRYRQSPSLLIRKEYLEGIRSEYDFIQSWQYPDTFRIDGNKDEASVRASIKSVLAREQND
jgi:predicted kinase